MSCRKINTWQRLRRRRKFFWDTPYRFSDLYHENIRGRPTMTSIRAAPGSIRHFSDFMDLPDFPAERIDTIRDAAAKMFYFMAIATAFAFVWILTTGTHP